jgi:hypothetical protein
MNFKIEGKKCDSEYKEGGTEYKDFKWFIFEKYRKMTLSSNIESNSEKKVN